MGATPPRLPEAVREAAPAHQPGSGPWFAARGRRVRRRRHRSAEPAPAATPLPARGRAASGFGPSSPGTGAATGRSAPRLGLGARAGSESGWGWTLAVRAGVRLRDRRLRTLERAPAPERDVANESPAPGSTWSFRRLAGAMTSASGAGGRSSTLIGLVTRSATSSSGAARRETGLTRVVRGRGAGLGVGRVERDADIGVGSLDSTAAGHETLAILPLGDHGIGRSGPQSAEGESARAVGRRPDDTAPGGGADSQSDPRALDRLALLIDDPARDPPVRIHAGPAFNRRLGRGGEGFPWLACDDRQRLVADRGDRTHLRRSWSRCDRPTCSNSPPVREGPGESGGRPIISRCSWQ